MNKERKEFYLKGLSELPSEFVKEFMGHDGAAGETIQYDEAEVWKRVLNYRIIQETRPDVILETHMGKGVSTNLYARYSDANVISLTDYETQLPDVMEDSCDLIDIDPFGQPYKCLVQALPKLKNDGVLMVTNGEMMSVTRNLKKTQYLTTDYYGKQSPKWVTLQYLPYLEKLTGLSVQYFYAFPTTVRAVLSNREIPSTCFSGCKSWMWWLGKYAVDNEVKL